MNSQAIAQNYFLEFAVEMKKNADFNQTEFQRQKDVILFCCGKLSKDTRFDDPELLSLADYVTKKMLTEQPEPVRIHFMKMAMEDILYNPKSLSTNTTGVANAAAVCQAYPDAKFAEDVWERMLSLNIVTMNGSFRL